MPYRTASKKDTTIMFKKNDLVTHRTNPGLWRIAEESIVGMPLVTCVPQDEAARRIFGQEARFALVYLKKVGQAEEVMPESPAPITHPDEAMKVIKQALAKAQADCEMWKVRAGELTSLTCEQSDENGSIYSENQELLVENAQLRRKIDRLEREAAKRKK